MFEDCIGLATLIWRGKTSPANVTLAIDFGNRRMLTQFDVAELAPIAEKTCRK
jgi:hypothetical protein